MTKQENVLLSVFIETTEPKVVELETRCTVILPPTVSGSQVH